MNDGGRRSRGISWTASRSDLTLTHPSLLRVVECQERVTCWTSEVCAARSLGAGVHPGTGQVVRRAGPGGCPLAEGPWSYPRLSAAPEIDEGRAPAEEPANDLLGDRIDPRTQRAARRSSGRGIPGIVTSMDSPVEAVCPRDREPQMNVPGLGRYRRRGSWIGGPLNLLHGLPRTPWGGGRDA